MGARLNIEMSMGGVEAEAGAHLKYANKLQRQQESPWNGPTARCGVRSVFCLLAYSTRPPGERINNAHRPRRRAYARGRDRGIGSSGVYLILLWGVKWAVDFASATADAFWPFVCVIYVVAIWRQVSDFHTGTRAPTYCLHRWAWPCAHARRITYHLLRLLARPWQNVHFL